MSENPEYAIHFIEEHLDGNLQSILFSRAWNARENIMNCVRNKLERQRLRIAVVGQFSSGKTSFLNELFGAEIGPKGIGATTHGVTEFYWDKHDTYRLWNGRRSCWKKLTPEQYRDAVVAKTEAEKVPRFRVGLNAAFLQCHSRFLFIDTPGFNADDGGIDRQTSIDATNHADSILLLISVNAGTLQQDVVNYLKSFYDKWNSTHNPSQTEIPPLRIILSRADKQKDTNIYPHLKNEILNILKKNDLLQAVDEQNGGGVFLYAQSRRLKEGTDWSNEISSDMARLEQSWDEWFQKVEKSSRQKCERITTELSGHYNAMLSLLNAAVDMLEKKMSAVSNKITYDAVRRLIRKTADMGTYSAFVGDVRQLAETDFHELATERYKTNNSRMDRFINFLIDNEARDKEIARYEKTIQKEHFAQLRPSTPAWLRHTPKCLWLPSVTEGGAEAVIALAEKKFDKLHLRCFNWQKTGTGLQSLICLLGETLFGPLQMLFFWRNPPFGQILPLSRHSIERIKRSALIDESMMSSVITHTQVFCRLREKWLLCKAWKAFLLIEQRKDTNLLKQVF